jgi:outer membrane protein assembly factor BamB
VTLAVIGLAAAMAWAILGRGTTTTARGGRPPVAKVATFKIHPPPPIPGYLLIADRGNNRILLVDSRKRIIWRYPRPGSSPSAAFRFDDDAFFAPGFRRIISNQEDQHTIEVLSFPEGSLRWIYGHVNVRGHADGYLNTPDDAYLLPNGLRTVADAYNCRVLFLAATHRIVRTIGTTGTCSHDPPRTLGAVNGATPLPNGDTLVSEIAGWIDDVTRNGRLRWSFRAPVSYPSDPQPLPGGRILLADYARPGHALIVDHHGRVLWRYGPPTGSGALDHPSLALPLGHGLIAVNDDYRNRVVLISIHTHRIVWQYGVTDTKGSEANHLNTPDGMDLLPNSVVARSRVIQTLAREATRRPPRAASGGHSGALSVTGRGRLPAAVQRAVAVGLGGHALVAGGLDAAQQSTNGVFSLDTASGRTTLLGSVPQAFHDAAGALIGRRLLIFGGGAVASSSAVQAFDLRSHQGTVAAHLPTPLSDLVAARIRGTVYLVGGYDGTSPQSSVYATESGTSFRRVARLPIGLRYPAVGTSGGDLVVAGGRTRFDVSPAVYVVDPRKGTTSRIGSLPDGVSEASAISGSNGRVYILGGRDAAGNAVTDMTVIDASLRSITPLAPLHTSVADAAVAHIGRDWYLIGGWRGANLNQILAIRPP